MNAIFAMGFSTVLWCIEVGYHGEHPSYQLEERPDAADVTSGGQLYVHFLHPPSCTCFPPLFKIWRFHVNYCICYPLKVEY